MRKWWAVAAAVVLVGVGAWALVHPNPVFTVPPLWNSLQRVDFGSERDETRGREEASRIAQREEEEVTTTATPVMPEEEELPRAERAG